MSLGTRHPIHEDRHPPNDGKPSICRRRAPNCVPWIGPAIVLKKTPVVLLCGGRGSRLGEITTKIPKSLVKVHDRPLLWYTILTLFEHGFRHFILPLGYKGEMIRTFVASEFGELHAEFEMVDTGEEATIGSRIHAVVDRIPDHEDFFLLNGDTFFDFDILGMYQLHRRQQSLLTLSSVEVHSAFGLIIEEAGKMVDFARDRRFSSLILDASETARGYVNAGLAWINKDALGAVDLATCENFEQDLFSKMIQEGRASHFKIEGNWFPIDNQKDLDTVNQAIHSRNGIGAIVKAAKKNLASRYTYKTRYFSDADELKKRILDKTVVPHQVEVQPGPDLGKAICWLKCPYCYGGSSRDDGVRLSPERYVEVMQQIADGGVNKVVFAGYATDPLNYSHIDDLLRVATQNRQIFGFHTKALKFSDRFLQLLTAVEVTPLSYFGVSVDAGTNTTYNQVHGVGASKAKLYDSVLRNLTRIAEARARTGAPLDLSATFLVNSFNCSTEEVRKAIDDLRNTGFDLIRFTFPQAPRGHDAAMDPWIPQREQIDECLERLTPVIEAENGEKCQVLILDLDSDYDIYRKPRTLPCFARFVFPSIGFDGYLSHCSESAAPHFRKLALGNLATRDFWDLFYDYDAGALSEYLKNAGELMQKSNCKCDRKEHVVNDALVRSGAFSDVV